MDKWQISRETKEVKTIEYLCDEVLKRIEKEGFSIELFTEYNNLRFKIWQKEKQLRKSQAYRSKHPRI